MHHAYLAATRALLIHLQAISDDHAAVEALAGKVEREMLDNGASLFVCRYGDEPFNTAEIIGPHWSEIPGHVPSSAVFLGLPLTIMGYGWMATQRRYKRTQNESEYVSTICDSSDLVRRLDALTVDTFARFSGCIAGGDDDRPTVSADALLHTSMRQSISDRFRGRFAFFDERAVHSIWMRWYLHVLVPPFLLADILLDWTLPVALEDVRFIVGPDARIEAVKLLSAGQDTGGVEPFVRFRELIFSHLAPLIEMLAERTSVTRRVYWSNVGDEFEAMLRRIEQIAGRPPRLLEAQDILEQQTWPGNQANPLFNAVIYKSNNPSPRVRRICCLQYLLPDRRFCSACPVTCRSEK